MLLGSSAAIWGGWLERAGPRRALDATAALAWAAGIPILWGVWITLSRALVLFG